MRDVIWWLSDVTKVHLWFILIVTANYFMMPKQIGLNFRFNVASVGDKVEDDYRGSITASQWSTGHLRLAQLISWGFKAWFVLTMASYAFDDPVHGKDGVYFASTFRQRLS